MGQVIRFRSPSAEDDTACHCLTTITFNPTTSPGLRSFRRRKLRPEEVRHFVQPGGFPGGGGDLRGGSEPSRSTAYSPALTQSQRLGPCRERGRYGGWEPLPGAAVSPARPGRSACGSGCIDLPKPELSAHSDTIGFPLNGPIASTGFQFVFPEIHLPDTFLINSPPTHPRRP